MAYSTLATVVTGTPISSTTFGNVVKDNFDAAFPLGVDAWTSYTPTLTQSGALTKTVTYAKYQRIGRTIHLMVNLTITSAGTAGNAIVIGLPVAAASSSGVLGSFRYLDAGTTVYAGICFGVSTTTMELASTNNANPFGVSPAVTAANNDTIQVAVTYEAAS